MAGYDWMQRRMSGVQRKWETACDFKGIRRERVMLHLKMKEDEKLVLLGPGTL